MNLKIDSAPVLWITGLSGAGKSTLARSIKEQLHSLNYKAVLLDGDEFRAVIDQDLGHSSEARLKNAYRLARMSRLISDQGVTVICATMSLFPEIWDWNRSHMARYRQIYLKADRKILEERDSKGLYRQAREGAQENIIGWDLTFEEPTNSDLVIDSAEYSKFDLPDLSRKIIQTFLTDLIKS